MSRPVALAVAALLAMLAIGTIDYRVTAAKVPGVPPECRPVTDPVCNEARNLRFEERIDRVNELEQGLEGRAWLYALAAALAAVALVARGLRGAPADERRRALSALGAAGVGMGVVMTVLLSAANGLIDLPSAQMFFPCIVMAVIAGVGGTHARIKDPEAVARPLWRDASPWARRAAATAIALTCLTALLTVIFMVPQPECESGSDGPGWTDAVAAAAVISAFAAFLAGVVALVFRRWFVALGSFVVSPGALLLLLATSCAFY